MNNSYVLDQIILSCQHSITHTTLVSGFEVDGLHVLPQICPLLDLESTVFTGFKVFARIYTHPAMLEFVGLVINLVAGVGNADSHELTDNKFWSWEEGQKLHAELA